MIVYFAYNYENHLTVMYADEPQPLFQRIAKNSEFGRKIILQCPAITDYYKNIFTINSPFDYEITWTGERLESSLYNQEFFEKNIIDRGMMGKGVFSLKFPPLFLLAEEPLLASFSHPSFEDSDISKKLMQIGGQFDIGRHFRKIEYPFVFKEPSTVGINKGDVISYMKLYTDEKIQFKRFVMTPYMRDVTAGLLTEHRRFRAKNHPLSYFYNAVEKYKIKNVLLKEIKKNLFD